MNRGTAQQGLLFAWIGLVVIQIARAAGGQQGFHFPEPRLIVAPAVVYSGLSVIAMASPELAVAMAVGIDVASAISPGVMSATEKTMARVVGVSGTPSNTAPGPGSKSSSAPGVPVESGGGSRGPMMS